MRMVMVMVMMIASCTIDFFIKMTICHFPQFFCSMSVAQPHSVAAHTVRRTQQGRGVLQGVLQGCIAGRMLLTKHSLLAPSTTTVTRWGRTYELIIRSYVWGRAHLPISGTNFTNIHPMSECNQWWVGITHVSNFRWHIHFWDLNLHQPPSPPFRAAGRIPFPIFKNIGEYWFLKHPK